MRIAICDDDKSIREGIKGMLENNADLPGNVCVFEASSGIELIDEHKVDPFDIIFLDIEMDGMDGMEAGQEIRKIDKDVIIKQLSMNMNMTYLSNALKCK